VVPHWYSTTHRITYWNKFGRPDTLPLYYGAGSILMFWWQDTALAAALRQAVASGRPLAAVR
jgi:ABC-type oligopeptide transport system substrate-binding subunit